MYTTEFKKQFVHDYAMMQIKSLIEKGELSLENDEDVYDKYMALCNNLMEKIEPAD